MPPLFMIVMDVEKVKVHIVPQINYKNILEVAKVMTITCRWISISTTIV